MAADIGQTLFVDILGMTSYPGQPFTGNIFQDLILFLIVPTIFIIMVLYIASGRIIPDRKIRVMIGVGAYLFIIAGGYYAAFALLSGPYFIFLIFILGLLGFILGHFRLGGHGGGGGSHYSGGGNYSGGGHGGGGYASRFAEMNRQELLDEKERLALLIKDLSHEIDHPPKDGKTDLGALKSDRARAKGDLMLVSQQLSYTDKVRKKMRW